MISLKLKRWNIFLYATFIIIIDHASKYAVLNILGFDRSQILIPGLIKISLIKNTGAAFSLFSGFTPMLSIISTAASIVLVTIVFRCPPKSYWNILGITNLLGGTIGNGIDRLFRGYVLDFIELIHINFPIFNIADIAINIAVICFAIDLIRIKVLKGNNSH